MPRTCPDIRPGGPSVWPGVAAFSIILTLTGCGEEIESDPSTVAPTPRVALAASIDDPAVAPAFASHLYSEQDADVYSRLDPDWSGPAQIEEIRVEIGESVDADQVLAVLEDDELRIAVASAEAEAEQARSELARMEELRQRDLVSEAEHESARFAARRAEIGLERARLELAHTRVRAPFAGLVSRRYVRAGQRVDPDQPLFRVTAVAPLRARILVPEGRAGEFHAGAPVEITGANGERATGRIRVMAPAVDPSSGAREVLIELAEAQGFLPGASVTISPPAASER